MESITAEHFVRQLKRHMVDYDARFVFFLGAGCSISSGIPGASRLVRDWLPKLHHDHSGGALSFDSWISEHFEEYDQDNPAASYAKAFRQLCHTPQLRQREIERIVIKKDPGFGYAVLAQLMTHPEFGRHCNRVLTTNFDDLVADALYLYTRTKPLVIIHDSLIHFVEVGRARPLVVKLHGDALLEPKNLEDETAELSTDVADVLANLLKESGLVFLGYGGNDQSISRFLSALPADSLPNGVYWVNERKPDTPFGEWLDQKDSAFWVRHLDFDSLMVLIRREFDLDHPEEKRFDALMETYRETFKKLSLDVTELPEDDADKAALETAVTEAVQDFEGWWSVEFEANRYRKGDPEQADQIYRAGLAKFPDSASLHNNYALFLFDVRGDKDAIEAHFKRSLEASPDNGTYLGNYALFLQVIRDDMDGAEAYYKRALEADPNNATNLGNYAWFLKDTRNDTDGAEAQFKRALEVDPNHANNLSNYAGFLLSLGRYSDGFESLEHALSNASDKKKVILECQYYRFAHAPKPEQQQEALVEIKELINRGVRSAGFSLSMNVKRAREEGHPEIGLVEQLAKVIADEENVSTLERYSVWQET